MDLATIVGVLLAFGGIFGAQVMEGGNPASIMMPAPLILVVCGTLGAAMASATWWGGLPAPWRGGALAAGSCVGRLGGVLLATVVSLRMGARLKRVSELECEQMELAIEGILAIQAGANPRLVAQKLKSLLPPGEAEKKKAA